MKTVIFFLTYLIMINSCFAQQESDTTQKDMTVHFPGGEYGLLKFCAEECQYPINERRQGIQGVVIISFYVMKDGSIDSIKILNSVSHLLDNEVIRVIRQTAGKWNTDNQIKYEPAQYMLPMTFRLGPAIDLAKYHTKGDKFFSKQKYRKTLKYYNKIIYWEPNNIDLLLKLGTCKFNRNDIDGACESWQDVAKYNSNKADNLIIKHCK